MKTDASKQIIFIIFFIIGILFCQKVWALCIWNGNHATAASPYAASDVAECLSDAATKSGDVTITIPEGRITWTSAVSIDMTSLIHVSSLTIRGNHKRQTVIRDATWSVITVSDKKFRLTNLSITGKVLDSNGAAIRIRGNTKPSSGGGFRIDSLIFDSDDNPGGATTARAIAVHGDAFGVIDNIIAGWYGQFSIVYSGIANTSWASEDSFGTSDAVYLENCTLSNKRPTQSMLMDHWDGARIVIRYNTVSGYYFGGHDNLDNIRSNRHWEFYNNVAHTGTSWGAPLFSLRGGTGFVFNNEMISSVAIPFYGPSQGIALTNYRSWSKRNTWCDNIPEKYCAVGTTKPCTTDADCGGASGSCQQEDGNIDGTGYPCRGQIGRGKSMESRPALFWNNTVRIRDDAPYPVGAYVNDNCIADSGETLCNPLAIASGNARWMATHHIREGRDFCNGSMMPAVCNGVATSYTPYTCPHPLAGEGNCNVAIAGREGYWLKGTDASPPAEPDALTVN